MIKYFNRKTKNYEIEKVAGDKYLSWTYSSPVGMNLLELIIKKKLFSKLYGMTQDFKMSRKKIASFIKDLDIDMTPYENSAEDYKNFNDFFSRKLKKGARSIDLEPSALISPGDGRLIAYENIDIESLIQIKGLTYSLRELICSRELAEKYSEGTFMVLRLCPTDYHRFHFLDSGSCSETHKINGYYYSVNPTALQKIPKLFCQNKREWSVFKSDNFGDILYIEVGATCVGSIIQTYKPDARVNKGDEKGYFKFGGSTVILFFEKNKVKIASDILEQSSLGYECKVSVGENIGEKFI